VDVAALSTLHILRCFADERSLINDHSE